MWDKVGPRNWRRPLLLRPDNFTPPSRTPWGGRRIRERLKADVQLPPGGPVGEAWELSVEPDFPSRLADGPTLDEVLRADPALLGAEAQNRIDLAAGEVGGRCRRSLRSKFILTTTIRSWRQMKAESLKPGTSSTPNRARVCTSGFVKACRDATSKRQSMSRGTCPRSCRSSGCLLAICF